MVKVVWDVCICTVLLVLALPQHSCFSVPTTTPGKRSPPVTPRESLDGEERATGPPHLVFPGGGIFFYWQAGAVTYLREQGYNLTATSATGASAGALTATLTAASVDFCEATSLALDLAARAGVWNRKQGLQGIWGPLISEWLDELLPEDALVLVRNRLTLLVTPIPSFQKSRIETFHSRQDLIHCNMASVHIPWFLDGKLVTTNFRDQPCIDGSFLARKTHYVPDRRQDTLILDYNQDPAYQGRGLFDFVSAFSPEGIWSMMEDGKRYAELLEEQGGLQAIPKQTH